jgi:hypothetical protein
MRNFIIIILLAFNHSFSFAQGQKIAGKYTSVLSGIEVIFYPDSTFQYVTKGQHPTFSRWENFNERGRWLLSADTIILNPQLPKKVFVESDFKEEERQGDTGLILTCNHIKRYFDANGNVSRTDTVQIDVFDYSFNELKKKKLTRVARFKTVRCAFAGYIPKEIIITNRTINIQRTEENIGSIFISCNELQGTKEFVLSNEHSNHFTMNVYSSYYQDGQIRQMRLLIKNENVLYTRQNENGKFEKDNFWTKADAELKRQKKQAGKKPAI